MALFGSRNEEMKPVAESAAGKFASPQEEVAYLRAQIAERERAASVAGQTLEKPVVAQEKVAEYRAQPAAQVLAPEYQLKAHELEEGVLQMGKEHEETIDELVRVMMERGIKNALTILEKLNDPHIEDDFHRFLVQFLLDESVVSSVSKERVLFRALRMRLYEVTLPPVDPKGESRSFADLVTGMEQFYAGMLSIEKPSAGWLDVKNYFTLELALSNFSSEIVFYASVPLERADLFEKQVLAVYPDAKLREHKEDYNPFSEKGSTLVSVAEPVGSTVFPVKTFEAFPQDPLNVLLSAFSKMKHEGEGAAVQFVIKPSGKAFNEHYKSIREDIKKGIKVKEALKHVALRFTSEFSAVTKELFFGTKKKEEEIDQEAVESITEKIASPIVDTNIRIVVSAETEERAKAILTELESAFNQFTKPQANGMVWKRLAKGDLMSTIYEFSFRMFDDKESFPLNLKELTTMFHFPVSATTAAELKEAKAGGAPAPMEMASEGIILGKNIYHNKETLVRMGREDRVRHFYVIGQTGTGKSKILQNMIVQDMRNGDGVCYIDPHGTDVQEILALVPPERADDVIYFDPSYTERPMGLNMLEYDHSRPEQKTFVVNEMMDIFNQLFDMKAGGGGPMFEQYFKNAAFLAMEDTSEQATLLDITRILADKAFRDLKLSRCKNPIIIQFWASAEKTTGDQGLANFVPYISSKFDPFISNDIMRPVVLQKNSSFNFREIMDNKKILLVNLSKGRLGDINADLIGLVLVGKITMAALSRVDMFGTGKKPNDFYLYIDEFHNVTTPAIATILSEARKYRLSLNVAHQYISQLSDEIKNAIFGNVGNMAIFRVGQEEAEYLEKNFAPTFSAQDLARVDNYNAYVKMLVNGQPTKPFNIVVPPPEYGNPEMAEKLKQLSYLKYGKPREEVEAEIFARFRGEA